MMPLVGSNSKMCFFFFFSLCRIIEKAEMSMKVLLKIDIDDKMFNEINF